MSQIFATSRLTLRRLEAEDLDLFYDIVTDAFVRRYLFDDAILSRIQVAAMLAESQKLHEKGVGLWLIEANASLEGNHEEDHKVIGLVGLWYFFDEPQPQLVYALLPAATHQGYMTEAAVALMDYCFNNLGYRYLTVNCDAPNLASQRVALRLGMVKTEQRMVEGKSILVFRRDAPSSTGDGSTSPIPGHC